MRSRGVGVWCVGVMAAVAFAGCAPVDDDDDWVDDATDEIAVRGSWAPSSTVRAAADRQSVRYDDAPNWRGPSSCGGRFLPGSQRLGDYLRRNFSAVSSYGGYSCRQNTADASKVSVHGTGRAIDVFIPMDRGAADNTRGDVVAGWLVSHAQEIGVQYVVWDRTSFNASRAAGAKFRPYGGPNPHIDHIHVELNVDGANMRTAWFR